MTALDMRSNRLSVGRLVTALASAVALLVGFQTGSTLTVLGGAALSGVFMALAFAQALVHARRELEAARMHAHARHLARADGSWKAWLREVVLDEQHPYTFDIDLDGPGSLMARLDVTGSTRGRALLLRWLGGSLADASTLHARQHAIAELSAAPHLRVELEVSARRHDSSPLLSAERYVEFTRGAAVLAPFQRAAMWLFPALTGLGFVGGQLGLCSPRWWLVPFVIQSAVIASAWARARRHFDLLDARKVELEAYGRLLATLEAASFTAPRLRELQLRLNTSGARPSQHLRRLSRWAALAEVRMQFLVHPVLNFFLLWDLHVLRGLERWNEQAGRHVDDWLSVVAEFEALSSLAALYGSDAGCTFPFIVAAGEGLEARALAHPLLEPEQRVANDVLLEGPGAALIVTGSNMAGKSTLLRAIGLNTALGLAGGSVCAESMRLPRVRLRASMRASDALQKGASYFYAELVKLQTVVADLHERPPVLFLLDELLRGTNAQARSVGAAAVVRHLTASGAMGLVATHDPALCALADDPSLRLSNVHFTDVMVDGEITFDYRLRPGPATTSNALQLLQLAGIPLQPENAALDANALRAMHRRGSD